MALHVHRSNRTERLVDALVGLLRAPPADPFARDAVVVHSKGLERFLQHELARRLGICAQVAFPFPSDLARPAQASPWRLMAALAGDAPALAPLRRWIDGEDRRLVELASVLGGVFDRYTWYRPGLELLPWEAELYEPPTLALADDLPDRLVLFSVGTLPPALVELVARLAEARDVHVMVLAPSRRNARAHPLLASLGKVAHEFQAALLDRDPVVHDAFDDPGRDTLLARVQAELLDDRWPAHRREPSDDSVRVHACHGPARQLQVLRDELTALLDRHRDLQPRDIVVMAPDIGVFAPLVEATFHDRPWLPVRLADRGWGAENPVLRVLLDLLALADGRLGASDVLALAELPPVQLRFGLTPDDLPELRHLAVDAGIRFGADAAHRAALGLPHDDGYTWRFGLDRLLLGQAVAHDEVVLGRVPAGSAEGRDERARLGALVDLADSVIEALVDLGRPRTCLAWRDRLSALLDTLCAVDEPTSWQRRQADQVLAELAEAPAHGFDRPLDRHGLHRWLEQRVTVPEPGAGFLAGAITFCQLVPMRAIPFRVVVLLGMDDGAFPRPFTPLGFDRLAADPRPGDRTVRDDDRALFLDALLSARDHLLVLYTGRDARTGQERPPAVPVAELLDHVDPGGLLTVHHPLQPFSPRAFDGRPAYEAWLARAAAAPKVEPRPFFSTVLDKQPIDDVDLDDLIRFFRAPIRTLMTRGLGAWGPDEEAVVEDAVPQDLDGLGLWAVRDAVLGRVLAGRDPDELVGAGLLPFGMPGRALLADARREVAAILGDAPPPAPPVAVSVELEGFAVRGHASDAMVHAGSLSAAHRFAGWITHVARAAAGHDTPTTVRARKGAVTYAPVSRLLALDVLGNLVQLYRYGRRLPLLWFPETTWGIACKWRSLPWGGLRDREPDPWTRRVLGGRNPFDDDLTDVVPVPRGCSARELGETLWRPARAAEVRR